jgi:hypothetical protein
MCRSGRPLRPHHQASNSAAGPQGRKTAPPTGRQAPHPHRLGAAAPRGAVQGQLHGKVEGLAAHVVHALPGQDAQLQAVPRARARQTRGAAPRTRGRRRGRRAASGQIVRQISARGRSPGSSRIVAVARNVAPRPGHPRARSGGGTSRQGPRHRPHRSMPGSPLSRTGPGARTCARGRDGHAQRRGAARPLHDHAASSSNAEVSSPGRGRSPKRVRGISPGGSWGTRRSPPARSSSAARSPGRPGPSRVAARVHRALLFRSGSALSTPGRRARQHAFSRLRGANAPVRRNATPRAGKTLWQTGYQACG